MRRKERDLLLLLLTLVALRSVYSIATSDAPSDNLKLREDVDLSSTDSLASQDTDLTQIETLTEDVQIATDTDVSSNPQRIPETDEPIADTQLADEDVDPLLDVPSGLFEVVDADSVDTHKRQNYASLDAGATILDAAPDTKSPTNLLVPDKDRYMLTPCSNSRKWVVISLSEDVHADAIAVANYEKFSSTVKDFIVLGSINYPTDTWLVLGNFTATHTNGEQIFQLDAQQHVRYIKFRFLSHYGSEYYCTLSQLRVFGRTFTQVISQLEKSIDAEVEALDAKAAILTPLPSPLPDSAEVSVSHIPDPTELTNQCLMEKNNTVAAVFYDKAQQIEHYRDHGMCCLVDYTPEQIGAEAAANNAIEHVPTSSLDLVETDGVDGAVPVATPVPDKDASNVSVVGGSSFNTTASSSGAVSASLVPTAHGTAVSSTQGLGPLESIFVRITKKIQALEANQSVMGRQLEELHTHQSAAIEMLQSNQESLKEIRTMIVDLKDNVTKELSAYEQTLMNYGRLLDDVRRENIALWVCPQILISEALAAVKSAYTDRVIVLRVQQNEMLIVREVIRTMKAGILCAIILSGCIILFYLLRLLFRCVSKCKERADLREWFWRMEHQESSGGDTGTNNGALRVNRRAQFGSSWDDSAIERKTLVSDIIGDGPQKFRRRTKRSSQPSSSLKRCRK
ncbi:hypothetical protein DD237_006218 [Peronospora effusa]|uniref:SUN domain-containing protein n=1 Tax=Peronospora effusa TaxID=542832 RepID=A0A3R7W6Z0_9STRA|nr:hypothetical protein DD237_006218 [Peronospora effusa]